MAKKAIRLPPLKILRVHDPKSKSKNGNPCIAAMSTVLACWASVGYSAPGCAAVETALRQCMDGPQPPPAPFNPINHHLARMKQYMTQQTTKKAKSK